MRGRWQPSGWVSTYVGSNAANLSQVDSMIKYGMAGTRTLPHR
jgi:hypothetical protein